MIITGTRARYKEEEIEPEEQKTKFQMWIEDRT